MIYENRVDPSAISFGATDRLKAQGSRAEEIILNLNPGFFLPGFTIAYN
jgi:hypothetical protein